MFDDNLTFIRCAYVSYIASCIDMTSMFHLFSTQHYFMRILNLTIKYLAIINKTVVKLDNICVFWGTMILFSYISWFKKSRWILQLKYSRIIKNPYNMYHSFKFQKTYKTPILFIFWKWGHMLYIWDTLKECKYHMIINNIYSCFFYTGFNLLQDEIH